MRGSAQHASSLLEHALEHSHLILLSIRMQLSITPAILKLLQDSCLDDTLEPVSACALHDASSLLSDVPEVDQHFIAPTAGLEGGR